MTLQAGKGEVARGGVGRGPDWQRLNSIAEHARGPGWLREIVALLADEALAYLPSGTTAADPRFYYRH